MTTDPTSGAEALKLETLKAKLSLAASAAAAAGIRAKDGVLPDLLRIGAAELTVDRDGFPIDRQTGKFVPGLEWFARQQRDRPWLFEPAASPATKSSGPKVVTPGEAGQHLADIAAGRVTVAFKSDGTA